MKKSGFLVRVTEGGANASLEGYIYIYINIYIKEDIIGKKKETRGRKIIV